MDRTIEKSGQIPLETDLLGQARATMNALGWALQGLIGTATLVDGLSCIPTGPASMQVQVTPGQIFSLQQVDAATFSTLAADTTHQIVKQGLLLDTATFTLTAPVTSGQSQNYLVQAIYQDVDDTPVVRPYYNSANPAVAFSGPGGTGVADNTWRRGKCTVAIKAGVAATTGSQVTPAPDAGYTGLYAITVANGQTTVASGNISQLATAPFIATKLPSVPSTAQAGGWNYAVDTGAANAMVVTLSPIPGSIPAGFQLRVKVANSNTSTAATVLVNGLGPYSVKRTGGVALLLGDLKSSGIYDLIFDGAQFQIVGGMLQTTQGGLQSLIGSGRTGSSGNFTVPANVFVLDVELWGGGGGGSGANSSQSGSGGGGGEHVNDKVAVTPGQVIAYVVGDGGVAGTAGGSAGSAGTNTTFGSLIAHPAGGATTQSTPGVGGTGSAAAVHMDGQGGVAGSTTGVVGSGGDAGGGGGKGGTGGSPSSSPGGGGAGALPSSLGGSGASGGIVIRW